MTLRILVTGSRDWWNAEIIREAIATAGRDATVHPQEVTIVHGGARGADTIASDIGNVYGCDVEAHPADWDTHGKAAGHRRNAEMVALGADICLAFPIGKSPGTRGCIALAEKAGIPVVIHEGSLT